jgi:hypothetical protein
LKNGPSGVRITPPVGDGGAVNEQGRLTNPAPADDAPRTPYVPHQHATFNPHAAPTRAGRSSDMANTKKTEEKIERMLNAWRTLAPEKTFGGMTLAQFEAAAAPSLAARRKIDELDAQRADAVADRDTSDDAFETRADLVVAGVLADPTEGPDSALYGAFGYTRTSERKTGLTRKRNTKPSTS